MIRGIAGIPPFMENALSGLVDASKATTISNTAIGKPFVEECGLFLFIATDWTPKDGWEGRIQYASITNTSRRQSGFAMDNEEVSKVLATALLGREQIVEEVCERYGWHPHTPWTVAFYERANAEWDAQHDGIHWTPEQKASAIEEYMRSEQMDLAQGWEKKALGYLAMSREEGVLSGTAGSRLTAAEWLMVRGTSVLAGIGHSHPQGLADISPEDYFHTGIVESWQKLFQARYVHVGQKKDSRLESVRGVGCWIYAMPERVEIFDASVAATGGNLNPGGLGDAPRVGPNARAGAINNFRFAGHSSLVRYDKRGVRGSWRGPF